MSRGPGQIEQRIGELFAATRDRALSVDDIADHAFALGGAAASRAQRLSATRGAHRVLTRAVTAVESQLAGIRRVIAETEAALGRPPQNRQALWSIGGHWIGVDRKFAEAMRAAPSWASWQRGWAPYRRVEGIQDWRETPTADRRLWFHAKDRPVRVWAVSIQPAGVIWADTELINVTDRHVMVRYAGAVARLGRDKLSRWWAFWRGVMFASSRTGHIAERLDALWQQRYGHASGGVPPVMQMPLARAMELLGVPSNYSKEDVIAGFRRAAKKAHPDMGGTAELFRLLVEARDRLLAALGTSAPPPRMPAYYASGTRIVYRSGRSSRLRLGHTRRLGQTRLLAR